MNSDFQVARHQATRLEAILYVCRRVAQRHENHVNMLLRVNTPKWCPGGVP
jgi:hypothetical protein